MKPKLYLLDLDGTVYRGSEPIPGAEESIRVLLARGARVRYLTNNSAATPDGVARKLRSMSIPCEPDWVYTSTDAAAQKLLALGHRCVFAVGEPGLFENLRRHGLETTFGSAPDAVLVGVCRSLTYELVDQALQHLLRGTYFLATNTDATYPLEADRVQPGAGAIVAAIATAAGRQPEIAGKPEPHMVQQILARENLPPEEALLVGDRVETDIECGLRAGVPVLLVMTGVTSEPPQSVPSAPDLRALL